MNPADLQESWAGRFGRNPRLQTIIHTHLSGQIDVTPWARSVAWGNSIGLGAPSFEISLNDPRKTVHGKAIMQMVRADPFGMLRWKTTSDPWDLIECGDWLEIVCDYGLFSATNFLGWLDTVADSDTVDHEGKRDPTTKLAGEALDAVLDLKVALNPNLKGLSAYYDMFSPQIDAAFTVGHPGLVATAALKQALELGGSYPRLPVSLQQTPGNTSILGTLDIASEIDPAIDGGVMRQSFKPVMEDSTARSIISPILGIPTWAEMFLELRPVFLGSPVWTPKLVYRMRPWDELAWKALPVTTVDLASHDLKRGAGGYFNYFYAVPTLLPAEQHTPWKHLGDSPYIPILDLEGIYKFGMHSLEPALGWYPPGMPGWTMEYHARMNQRLWAWWSLGATYWQGTLTCNGFRPDIRLGQKVRAAVRGRELTFYVESYNHSLSLDQGGGLVSGKTELGVSRGQPGDWVDPGPAPMTVLSTLQTIPGA